MIFSPLETRIKKLESYLGISNFNYEYGFNVWGYIYQIDLSFFLGYIYILEDGLNKVNPKATKSLEIDAIWKKKRGWL